MVERRCRKHGRHAQTIQGDDRISRASFLEQQIKSKKAWNQMRPYIARLVVIAQDAAARLSPRDFAVAVSANYIISRVCAFVAQNKVARNIVSRNIITMMMIHILIHHHLFYLDFTSYQP
jgi:hypothetical protein